jgi:flagellar biosynthetic protein FliP
MARRQTLGTHIRPAQIRQIWLKLCQIALGLVVCTSLLTSPATAQDIAINFGDETSVAARSIQLLVLITVLSLVPGLAVMITCFPFIVTVLSILRQAIGLQQSPPNMLIISLALFLTWFVMDPVFTEAWVSGLKPLQDGLIEVQAAIPLVLAPFRAFMSARLDPDTFTAMADLRPATLGMAISDAPLSLLVPSFILSEIQRAFEIGFLIFLPFLIIDLVVAAILMSMGMMMVPPAVVSLPFKLAFFVVADGWSLIAGALVRSYI